VRGLQLSWGELCNVTNTLCVYAGGLLFLRCYCREWTAQRTWLHCGCTYALHSSGPMGIPHSYRFCRGWALCRVAGHSELLMFVNAMLVLLSGLGVGLGGPCFTTGSCCWLHWCSGCCDCCGCCGCLCVHNTHLPTQQQMSQGYLAAHTDACQQLCCRRALQC
jgi:hypothetical protein